MKPMLQVINVTKIYHVYRNNLQRLKEIFFHTPPEKTFIANKNISFDLHQGETLGIIGVNGAGKSTLLKQIAGVVEPTEGQIIKHGRVTALLELGTGFNNEMTGRDNILLNGTLIGMTPEECQQKEADIIQFSELGDYIDEPIKTYSSGMKMRLAFSIALYSDPQILIVDEALSVGDAHFSAKCTKALAKKKQSHMAIIYVSHDLNSLKLLCDRVILLNQGQIVKEGDPDEVINTYNFLIAKLNEADNLPLQSSPQSNAYGTLDIQIQQVTLQGHLSKSQIVSSGEDVTVTLTLVAQTELPNMTIGIMIRDRFGQDIFGTNTFHHHKTLHFQKNKTYQCQFTFPMNIGVGKYTLTVATHAEDTHLTHCAHWIDNALEFEVAGIQGAHFQGLCRLEPQITFQQISENVQ